MATTTHSSSIAEGLLRTMADATASGLQLVADVEHVLASTPPDALDAPLRLANAALRSWLAGIDPLLREAQDAFLPDAQDRDAVKARLDLLVPLHRRIRLLATLDVPRVQAGMADVAHGRTRSAGEVRSGLRPGTV